MSGNSLFLTLSFLLCLDQAASFNCVYAVGSKGVLLWTQAGAEGASGALFRLQLQKWAAQNSERKVR